MWELPTFEHVRTSVNKKQVSKNEIHAACVCNLTIGKIIWLQHLKFCNFTLWMPPCLGCQGPSSRSPPLCTPLSELQAHHCMTTKQLNWLLCSVSVIPPNKLSLRELNQLIRIKLLISDFPEILVFSVNFQLGRCPFCNHYAVDHGAALGRNWEVQATHSNRWWKWNTRFAVSKPQNTARIFPIYSIAFMTYVCEIHFSRALFVGLVTHSLYGI